MRIVHLTQSTKSEITGGQEYHVAYLTAALQRLGHEVIVVNTTALTRDVRLGETPSSDSMAHKGFTLPLFIRHHLDVLAETLTMFVRRFARRRHATAVVEHVERLGPDLVHQHSYIGELQTCRLISGKYPVVFTNHTGAYLHLNRWAPTRYLQHRWMKRFAAVIGPSRELTPTTGNSRYVPNGVDTTIFFPRSRQERKQLKLKYHCAGKRVFLCARRWAPTKGIIYLARALRRLSPAARASSVFLFAGNETPGYGRYQKNICEELARAGCEVRTLGNLGPAELAEVMNISDACIFPSLMEATSLACLEAMACATPVLATRTGGLLELVRHTENGWLVPPRNAGALATQIEDVLRIEPDALRSLGENALMLVERNYTWENAALETEKIYQEALRNWK